MTARRSTRTNQQSTDPGRGPLERLEAAESVCAETYQLLGAVVFACPGLVPNAKKWLDNLSHAEPIHGDLLPVAIEAYFAERIASREAAIAELRVSNEALRKALDGIPSHDAWDRTRCICDGNAPGTAEYKHHWAFCEAWHASLAPTQETGTQAGKETKP